MPNSALYGRKIHSPVRKGRGEDQHFFLPSPVRGDTTPSFSVAPNGAYGSSGASETPPSWAGLQFFRPNGLPIRSV